MTTPGTWEHALGVPSCRRLPSTLEPSIFHCSVCNRLTRLLPDHTSLHLHTICSSCRHAHTNSEMLQLMRQQDGSPFLSEITFRLRCAESEFFEGGCRIYTFWEAYKCWACGRWNRSRDEFTGLAVRMRRCRGRRRAESGGGAPRGEEICGYQLDSSEVFGYLVIAERWMPGEDKERVEGKRVLVVDDIEVTDEVERGCWDEPEGWTGNYLDNIDEEVC